MNDVAPYAFLTEERTYWRKEFYDKLFSLVELETNVTKAIYTIREALWTNITGMPRRAVKFIGADKNQINNYDPISVLEGAHTEGTPGANSVGIAIFTAAAMRAVGIPSRIVGVPHWNLNSTWCPNGDRDEACQTAMWVEVHDGKSWHFLNPQRDSTPAMDFAWFTPWPVNVQTPFSGNHSVYATSWRDTRELVSPPSHFKLVDDFAAEHFPMVFDDPNGHYLSLWYDTSVPAWDVTCRYNPTNATKCSVVIYT